MEKNKNEKSLQLQRASAGSGKTYTLAKKFLWLYITRKDAAGKRHLRGENELEDSLSHILAITFTVKATAEMKRRIVECLSALGNYTGNGDKDPDYLDDFAKALQEPKTKIAEVCRTALATLLHAYSEFNVSTIDAFFQSILRTFAYETQFTDGFNVELEKDLIVKEAVAEILEQLQMHKADEEVKYWVTRLMKDQSLQHGWNLFANSKGTGGKNYSASVYDTLMEYAQCTYKEDFKIHRKDLKEYFVRNKKYSEVYETLEAHYDGQLKDLHNAVVASVRKARDWFEGYTFGLEITGTRFDAAKVFRTLETADPRTPDAVNFPKKDSYVLKTEKKRCGIGDDVEDEINALFADIHEKVEVWKQSEANLTWNVYREGLAFLGLMQAVVDNAGRYLQENNTLDISETNTVLSRIIGDSDTPFIYERMGTIIHHFLIDEFQDTSKMQWQNLEPLLAESLADSESHENLIIGDAKQSIYRFRNAEPSLISADVPRSFGERIDYRGEAREDNTNWRSCRRIVEFNNTLFSILACRFSDRFGELKKAIHLENGFQYKEKICINDVFSNVVQYPKNRDDAGYVEVAFCVEKGASGSRPPYYDEFGPLVASLVKEGYRQRDIAFLVRTNGGAKNVISALIDYNAGAEEENQINFVSEEALLIGGARSVKSIVSVLELIARGESGAVETANEVAGAFNYYLLRHKGTTDVSAAMNDFFQGDARQEAEILKMVEDMQAVTLPSLVEAIVARFLTSDMKRVEAAFIAAFQDVVIDYCDNYSSDISSFLQWWDTKKNTLSIATPKNADAVSVITIHKAKGLEFPVVIIAETGSDQWRGEWKWTKPLLLFDKVEIPPIVPLNMRESVAKCPSHAAEYLECRHNGMLDTLNCHYVAMTRAKERLYIFMPVGYKKDGGFTSTTPQLAIDLMSFVDDVAGEHGKYSGERQQWLLPPEQARKEERDGRIYLLVGTPSHPLENTQKKNPGEIRKIEMYESREMPGNIQCQEDALPEVYGCGISASEKDLVRPILSLASGVRHLPLAVRRMQVAGLIPENRTQDLEEKIRTLMESEELRDYFDETGWTITTSRTLPPMNRETMYVPDRLLVDPEGNALFVTFLISDADLSLSSELEKYVQDAREAGCYRSVAGRLVPFKMDKIRCATAKAGHTLKYRKWDSNPHSR